MNTFKTHGVCSTQIRFELNNNIVQNVSFTGGCSGNLQGIASLVEGMDVDEVIKRLKGIRCSGGPSSCPDQLVQALEQAKMTRLA